MSNLEPPPAAAPSIAPPTPLAPVALKERVSSVDTLRGFALLGILAMNILAFALPSEAYMNPMLEVLEPYQGPFEGANRLSWYITSVLFDQKMMSIFSMLFGAGLILMGGRAAPPSPTGAPSTPSRFAGVYYRRLAWLFLIGMLHCYLIWYGDILVAYAICGALLYPLRRLKPGWLFAIGGVVMLVSVVITAGMGAGMMYVKAEAAEAQQIIKDGGTPTNHQKGMIEAYDGMMKGMTPTPERIQEQVAGMRGSYLEAVQTNFLNAVMLQTFIFAIWTFWRALGLMLIGMGLMKLGVFAATRSTPFYIKMAIMGLGVGVPLAFIGATRLERHEFDAAWMFLTDWHFNYIGSFFVALGYIGVVMLTCKAGILGWLRSSLAAVGQMAFTNYLMQSLVMTFIFNGWGLGNYARFQRAELYFFVAGMWILQLLISPLWLSRFRFGPAEWVWRSLTYAKPQPMLR